MSDQLATGRRVRILNVVDDYSRECIGQLVDVSISGERVSRLLERLAVERARPTAIVVDNGPEFTSKALFGWAQRMGVRLHFIQLGKPCQNAFVESFNGKFRDACLNEQSVRRSDGRGKRRNASRRGKPSITIRHGGGPTLLSSDTEQVGRIDAEYYGTEI